MTSQVRFQQNFQHLNFYNIAWQSVVEVGTWSNLNQYKIFKVQISTSGAILVHLIGLPYWLTLDHNFLHLFFCHRKNIDSADIHIYRYTDMNNLSVVIGHYVKAYVISLAFLICYIDQGQGLQYLGQLYFLIACAIYLVIVKSQSSNKKYLNFSKAL